MKNEDLDRFLQEAARDYNAPPETPADEMWAGIRAGLDRGDRRDPPARESEDPFTRRRLQGRRDGAGDGSDRSERQRRADTLRRWTPWALGIAAAATLAVGFGLGRVSSERLPDAAPSPELASSEASPSGLSLPVRLATAGHMNEAEALLTMYRTEDGGAERDATVDWARDLLSTTRMLMDSRAAEDPHMAELLGDLELVLVQISNAGTGTVEEHRLIEEGIAERQILTKLRTIASATMETTLE